MDTEHSEHDKAWEQGFIVPIARTMRDRDIGYLLITIRDDGKAAYVLEPKAPEAQAAHAAVDMTGQELAAKLEAMKTESA